MVKRSLFLSKNKKDHVKHNYHAITLDKYEISETDRLYTFYTLENGLIRVPARSVRKAHARLAMQVEDFTLAHITIAKNYGNGTLAGAVAEDYFGSIRYDLEALACVDRVRTMMLSVIGEHESDPSIFNLLVKYLHEIDQLASDMNNEQRHLQMSWITHAFLIQLFERLGYVFDLMHCVHCGNGVTETQSSFSVSDGGLLCVSCAKKNKKQCAVSSDTIKSLRVIRANHIELLHKIIVNGIVNRQLNVITTHIAQWVMR